MTALRLGQIRSATASIRRELAALAEVVEALVPPPPVITSPEEAAAVRQYLLAAARGVEQAFPREQPFAWCLVRRAWNRCPEAVRDKNDAEAETTGRSREKTMGRSLRSG